MKKRQSLKGIKPENGTPKNFDIALSSRFTDSKEMKASDAIQALIRDQQPLHRINCAGTEEFEDGSVYAYECDECPKNKECLERVERGKADEDALTDFFTKNPAALKAQEVSDLRDVTRIFCNAWIDRDSGFFREMADLMDAFADKEKVTPRVSVCDRTNLTTSPYHAAVLGAYMTWRLDRKSGKGDEEIDRAEFLQAVSNRFPEGLDERTFQRIIESTGIKFKRGKPGPKPARKKTTGKARE